MVKIIKIYDVKAKKKFSTTKYKVKTVKDKFGRKRKMVQAKSPLTGNIATRFVTMDFKK